MIGIFKRIFMVLVQNNIFLIYTLIKKIDKINLDFTIKNLESFRGVKHFVKVNEYIWLRKN